MSSTGPSVAASIEVEVVFAPEQVECILEQIHVVVFVDQQDHHGDGTVLLGVSDGTGVADTDSGELRLDGQHPGVHVSGHGESGIARGGGVLKGIHGPSPILGRLNQTSFLTFAILGGGLQGGL